MISAGAITLIIILVIIDLVCIVLTLVARSNLIACEDNENPYCPSYYCGYSSTECGNAPFHTVGDQTVCQTYLLKSKSKKYS